MFPSHVTDGAPPACICANLRCCPLSTRRRSAVVSHLTTLRGCCQDPISKYLESQYSKTFGFHVFIKHQNAERNQCLVKYMHVTLRFDKATKHSTISVSCLNDTIHARRHAPQRKLAPCKTTLNINGANCPCTMQAQWLDQILPSKEPKYHMRYNLEKQRGLKCRFAF